MCDQALRLDTRVAQEFDRGGHRGLDLVVVFDVSEALSSKYCLGNMNHHHGGRGRGRCGHCRSDRRSHILSSCNGKQDPARWRSSARRLPADNQNRAIKRRKDLVADAVLEDRLPVGETTGAEDHEVSRELPRDGRDGSSDVAAVCADDLGLCKQTGRRQAVDGGLDQAMGLAPILDVPVTMPVMNLQIPDVHDPDRRGGEATKRDRGVDRRLRILAAIGGEKDSVEAS